MNIIDRGIGICMVIVGIAPLAIYYMLEPYLGTLSGTVLYAVAILTSIAIALPLAIFVVYGATQAAGLTIIKVVETQ